MQQADYAYRFEWGLDGLQALAPVSDVVIIVDILRFTSAVCAALESGATVLPYRWRSEDVDSFAESHGAVVAGRREDGGPSLSPTDLLSLQPATRLVLPSPNGSTLACAAAELGATVVMAGSLRNATATAHAAARAATAASGHNRDGRGGVISVIGAGERWRSASGPLRPAVEDLLGAGAILAALDPSAAVNQPHCSPEAAAARAAFLHARPRLFEAVLGSSSGSELLERGWEDDVATSAALDVTDCVAVLVGNEFRA